MVRTRTTARAVDNTRHSADPARTRRARPRPSHGTGGGAAAAPPRRGRAGALGSRAVPLLVLAAGALLFPAPTALPGSVAWTAVSGAAPLAAQSVELRWKLEPGSVVVYRQAQETTSATPMGEITQSQSTVVRQEVLGVGPDGEADIRVTHESLSFEQDGPMGRQSWDSESDEDPADPAMAMAASLVGRSFEMTMAPDGRILRVAGMEDVLDEMLAGISDDPAVAAQARGMMESMFGEEGLETMMQQSMQPLPHGSVAPGHEWDHTLSVRMPFGTISSEYRYVLREVTTEGGRQVAKIDLTGTMGSLDPDPSNPMAGMMEMSGGEMSGEITFDIDRGLLLRSSVSTAMTMSVMQQSMAMNSTQEMELVDGA